MSTPFNARLEAAARLGLPIFAIFTLDFLRVHSARVQKVRMGPRRFSMIARPRIPNNPPPQGTIEGHQMLHTHAVSYYRYANQSETLAILSEHGRRAAARDLLGSIHSWFTEGFDAPAPIGDIAVDRARVSKLGKLQRPVDMA